MRQLVTLATVFTLVIWIPGCGKSDQEQTSQQQARGRTLNFERTVAFVSTSGDTLATILAAVADSEEERNTGLMNVRKLPDNGGMLFLFNNEQPRSFWMANTPLSLDILFVNADMEIVRIHHSTEPFSNKQVVSEHPAQYVVETKGGFCVSHDITEGKKISF